MSDQPTCPNCGTTLASGATHASGGVGKSEITGDPSETRTIAGELPQISPAEKPGDHIGRYTLLEQIGEGGCGVVYLAEQQEPIRRQVAIKVIKPGMDSKQILARFEAERQALALMDHPNIAKVLEAGATDKGRPYFAMELVKGTPITRYCDEHTLPTRERLELFVLVCQAIQHAHQKGVIHRDIKPSNILIADHDGKPAPRVIDFGIAKATAGQTLTDNTLFTSLDQFVGTPAYMSPEQARLSGLDIDTRSDIYSLGVLLYELLTGRTPFEAKRLCAAGFDEIRRIIREEDPLRPSSRISTLDASEQTTVARHRQAEAPKLVGALRGDLDWIVMKTLEKDRTRRYETANGLAMDIKRYLANEPIVARPPSQTYRLRKMVRRHQTACLALSVVFVSLVAGLGIAMWAFVNANAEKQRTEKALTQTRIALSASDLIRADRLIDDNKAIDALPYLVRGLTLNPSNRVALARLANLLFYHSWRVPTQILRHGKKVYFAEFSPDGKRVVTASFDQTARIWDAQTGQPMTPPLRHAAKVGDARFSPDGRWVATASDDQTARVWDAQTGLPVTKPLKHGDFVNSARFSPDGKSLVTTSDDQTARVWDIQAGVPLAGPLKHNGAVDYAEFSPDGKRVVTASEDKTARVWNARTGRPETEPLKHGDVVRSAKFSPDGKWIVTASDDKTARVWDAGTGLPLTGPLKHEGEVWYADFSPEGKRVVTASLDNTARVWDAQTGQPLTGPLRHDAGVWNAEFSPDGRWITTAASDQTARVWDAQTGLPLAEPMRHDGAVGDAQFSPDGRRIVTSSDDGTARVWETGSGRILTEPMKHDDVVNYARFSPDGNQVVTTSGDKTARLWDARTGLPLTEPLRHDDWVRNADFSPDGTRVVTASGDKTARVWDVQTGLPLTEPLKHDGAVYSAVFSPDGKRVLTASEDKTARVWDAQTGAPLTGPMKHDDGVNCALFSSDGNRVVTASFDKTARVWDSRTGLPLAGPLKHEGKVWYAEFSRDGKRIATASADQTARVWDAQTGRPVTKPLKHNDEVNSARFSPDGKWVATASDDRTARVWDAQTGLPLSEPLKHNDVINTLRFSPDGRRILTASDDKTARVWDAQTGLPLTEPLRHEAAVRMAQFSPDGRRVITASEDRAARIWDLVPTEQKYPGWLIELGQAISGQALNEQGLLEPITESSEKIIQRVRRELSLGSDNDDWTVWGRWLLADPSTRTISPYSKITVPQYIENRLKENTAQSLDEAERLATGNAELLARIAALRLALAGKPPAEHSSQ